MALGGTVVGKAPAGKNINSTASTNNSLYKNLFPKDAFFLQKVPRELIKDSNGRYWLKSENGRLITPSGKYEYVTLGNGKIMVVRPNSNTTDFSTHLGLSKGQDVKYAGGIRFHDNQGSSRGEIKEWNNESGHYKPSAIDAKNSGLPLNKFK